MARNPSPAEDLLKEVVAEAITPPLKVAGFRKSAPNYHRRHGETVQVVNVQLSHGSSAMEKVFYVNAGIVFDAMCQLMGQPVLETPKEYQCDECGTRDRLENLIPGALDRWALSGAADVPRTVGVLRGLINQLVAELDAIDSVAAYRAHRWFDRALPIPQGLNAQVRYLVGDLDGAWQEIQDLVRFLADRHAPPDTRRLVERLRLCGLQPRLS